jgi:hypothetical protein
MRPVGGSCSTPTKAIRERLADPAPASSSHPLPAGQRTQLGAHSLWLFIATKSHRVERGL